jgi:Low affinity iron permease
LGKSRTPTQRARLSIFDRFAEAASEFASHAVFFIGCALIVVLWLPSYLIIRSLNTWQLIINTLTTIITFLLVALLQNSQRRSEQALHLKLDALADGLADLVSKVGDDREGGDEFGSDVEKLRAAVGAEQGGRTPASSGRMT